MNAILILIDLFFAFYFFKMYEASGQKLYQIMGIIFLVYVAVIARRSSMFEAGLF